MVDIILELPPFKGVSREQLSSLLESIPLDFRQYEAGSVIAHPQEDYSGVSIVLAGEVKVSQTLCSGKVKFTQQLGRGAMPGVDKLWGLYNNYECTLEPVSKVSLMHISKAHFLELLRMSELILINYLNYISYRNQTRSDMLHIFPGESLFDFCCHVWKAVGERRSLSTTLEATLPDLASLTGLPESSLIAQAEARPETVTIAGTSLRLHFTSRPD